MLMKEEEIVKADIFDDENEEGMVLHLVGSN